MSVNSYSTYRTWTTVSTIVIILLCVAAVGNYFGYTPPSDLPTSVSNRGTASIFLIIIAVISAINMIISFLYERKGGAK